MSYGSVLESQISARAREIHTDSYPMSIGEVIGLYVNDELDIHPEFQRWFRWTDVQKTKLIESILLGIPVPPIFVAQREDGVWDVVDGLQRLSTIFQLLGILKDEKGSVVPALKLEKTRDLPALEGVMWDNPSEPAKSFTAAQKLDFKRDKLHFVIVKRKSHPHAKYDLFQRLNTGGTQLSAQEVRNCILVMMKPDFLDLLIELANHDGFKACVPLTDRQVEERYNLELVLRFVVLRRAEASALQSIDVGEFLTDKMIALCTDADFDLQLEARVFRCTFDLLSRTTGEDTFRKWDFNQNRATGAFSLSAYEVIAIGVGSHSEDGTYTGKHAGLADTIRSIWNNEEYLSKSGSGARASWRLPHLLPLGKKLFNDEDANI